MCGEVFFWGVHAGAELDFPILQDGRRILIRGHAALCPPYGGTV